MVTTRPMIRLSGFSRKTSSEDPTLSSSCCSLNCPNKRGSTQQLLKCDCDCEANNLFRQKLLQQQRQHQIQRNHHLLLLQLQAQGRKPPLKQPPPVLQKRPVYFPHPPPPKFRPTVQSDNNSESDRESLEHFHRHLQQLHRITCASLENAIYFGGSVTSSGKDKKAHANSKGTKVNSTKSFSFRDIRDIGKKKNGSAIPISRHQNSQASPSSSSCSSSLTQPSSLSPSSPKGAIKRRNTTRTAKDYIGVSRVKLLAKYWRRGKSSATDSGNGESTSRSSDSGESQLSNYSETGQSSSNISTSHKCLLGGSNRSALTPNALSSTSSNKVVSPNISHKRYPISQNNTNGCNNTVTYKVRYDIPSSWETEQLLSFASSASSDDHDDYQRDQHKHAARNKNKVGANVSSVGDNIPSEKDQDQVRHSAGCNRTNGKNKKDEKACTHCGRGPDSGAAVGHQDKKQESVLSTSKPKKTHIFKALTFVRSQNAKPKVYSSSDKDNNLDKSKKESRRKINASEENLSTKGLLVPNVPSTSSTSSLLCRNSPGRTMVQHKVNPVARSKSQKSVEKQRSFLSSAGCKSHPNSSKLVHTNSLLVIPSKNEFSPNTKCLILPTRQNIPGGFNSSSNLLASSIHQSIGSLHSVNHQFNQQQPKVRFKELQHHRSEQCLNERASQDEVQQRRINIIAEKKSSPQNPNMLPDEREHKSLYGCRIPRPKLKGIVPTHSYGVGGCSIPSSPVSRCSSGMCGENGGGSRVRRYNNGEMDYNNIEFTEISLQDDDSETSGFESEQNTIATTTITPIPKKAFPADEPTETDAAFKRKQQVQRNIPAEMTPAGKYFTDFKTLYHYQDQQQRLSIQKSPTPSRVLSFKKPQLPALLSRSGKKKGSFEDSSTAEFLKSLPIFRKLGDGFFAKLADHISEISFDDGDYIFHQGEKGDSMYFLVLGTAKATFKSLESGKSTEIFLKTLHPGDFFGEKMFQMRNGQYPNNVIASSEEGITCVKLDREAYEELIYKCHDFKIRVVDRTLKRNKLPDDIAKIRLDDLRIVTTLGVGGFGRVELCTLAKNSTRAFALKKMKKCQIVATRQIEHIRSEKSILLETNCDFICKLYKTFKDPKYLYMMMECCLGGELWTVLRDRGRFDDETAKFYIGCVIEALKYLHAKNIIYRDLKPENLLLDSTGYVKLVDFGFAKKLDGRKTWTFCGTPEYCAPEIILNKGHDLSADFWSLGVLMYELLTGTPPFAGGDPLRTYKIILSGIDAIEFPPTVSKYALNLIRKLCRDNPVDRLGAQRGRISDIKKHKWFDDFNWHGLQGRSLTPPIIPDVRGPLDFGNFDEYPPDQSGSPPDDLSGWDWDF